MVIWLIGLSGAGKTTLAEKLVEFVRDRGRQVVLVDGDRVRELFGNDLSHNLEDRRHNATRICQLCAFLDGQGIDVVCAFLSVFPESREWCRNQLKNYYEVFIDTPIEILQYRDSKGLYARHARGEIRNVVGLDLEFLRPTSPDLLIVNDGPLQALLDHVPALASRLCGDGL
jgi:adenylylsulfate kinase-like enzyme